MAFRRAIAGASFFPAGCGVLVGVRLTRGRRTVIVGRLGRIGRMERVNIGPNLPLGANTVSRLYCYLLNFGICSEQLIFSLDCLLERRFKI